MTVKQLIKKLKSFDQNEDVYISMEEIFVEELPAKVEIASMYPVEDVVANEGAVFILLDSI